jgi:redox-sensitive bicupin YhaK (pirin superfamily)
MVDDDGTRVRVACGDRGKRGPVDSIAAEPRYLDIFVPAGRRRDLAVNRPARLRPVHSRRGTFSGASKPFGVLTRKESAPEDPRARTHRQPLMVLFDSGDKLQSRPATASFFLVSGKPIPGAGRLVRADRDEHQGGTAAGGGRTPGTFIKHQ